MRSRKEILDSCYGGSPQEATAFSNLAILETLLDIREILDRRASVSDGAVDQEGNRK